MTVQTKPWDVLSREEREFFLEKSNWRGLYEFAFNWGFIIALFTILALYPNPFTIFITWLLFAGRQLGLVVLVHDAAHHSLFKSKGLNYFFAQWFAAAPLMMNVDKYRTYHLQHHISTGQSYRKGKGDPDNIIVNFYPVKPRSFLRFLAKDLMGYKGLLSLFGQALMLLGILKYDLSGRVTKLPQPERSVFQSIAHNVKALFPYILTNSILAGSLIALRYWWVYAVWFWANISSFMVIIRIRCIAEHGLCTRNGNQLQNTRTTYANWFERILFAPNRVHYHLEHHMLMTVPNWKLPGLHKVLKGRDVLDNSPIANNYLEIFRMAAGRSSQSSTN